MPTYPASIPLATRSLTRLTGMIRAHRQAIGSRWRKLSAGRQALLILAHLRNGDTLVRLAAGFGAGVATVWRYLREGIDLLAEDRPYHSGKHKRHGVNVQALADAAGRLVWPRRRCPAPPTT